MADVVELVEDVILMDVFFSLFVLLLVSNWLSLCFRRDLVERIRFVVALKDKRMEEERRRVSYQGNDDTRRK